MTAGYESVALSSRHAITSFDCGVPMLNAWLAEQALRAQGSGAARTFVWVAPGASEQVSAYFSLAPTELARAMLSRRATARRRAQSCYECRRGWRRTAGSRGRAERRCCKFLPSPRLHTGEGRPAATGHQDGDRTPAARVVPLGTNEATSRPRSSCHPPWPGRPCTSPTTPRRSSGTASKRSGASVDSG